MSMNCIDCEHWEGRDQETGEPICGYGDGVDDCPYNGEADATQEGSKIIVTIDKDDLNTRILRSFENSVNSYVRDAVKEVVRSEYDKQIRTITENEIKTRISALVDAFLAEPIQIGGGWREEARTLTRNEYLSETIQKNLESNFDKEKLSKNISDSIKSYADRFASSTKDDINRKVKDIFDSAMKQNLTESIVTLLMDNETYKRLSGSMQNLIGTANGS